MMNTWLLSMVICIIHHVTSQDVKVRLSGGNSTAVGRLEVYYDEQWGTVCGDKFSYIDAGVVCNSLGFGYNGRVIGNLYGPGTGPIWLDEMQCVGDERSIANCPHGGWGTHNCNHQQDVSVSCGSSPVQYGPLPNDGNFFLIADCHLDNIYQVDATTGVTGQLLPIGVARHPTSLAYDPTDKLIYWTDQSIHTINRYSLLIKISTVIYRDPSAQYFGLTIDVGRRKLYYADQADPVGMVGELSTDGSGHRVLIASNNSKPRGVVIDDVNRTLYWTDWSDTRPAIYRSSVVSPARVTLVSGNLYWPNALAVDFTAGVMYWGDAYYHRIEAANIDGTGRKFIRLDYYARYVAFALHAGVIYFTDWHTPYLGKMNVATKSIATIPGNAIFQKPTGIVFVPDNSDATASAFLSTKMTVSSSALTITSSATVNDATTTLSSSESTIASSATVNDGSSVAMIVGVVVGVVIFIAVIVAVLVVVYATGKAAKTAINSSTKTESGSPYDNPDALGGTSNTYDKPSTSQDVYSTIEVYDNIDEMRAGYAELQSVKPDEQATSSDAPEPPPTRPHEYLELVNVS